MRRTLPTDILHSLSTGPMGLNEIAADVGCHPQTAAKYLDILAHDLAIDADKRRGKGTQKKHVYTITGRGRALLARRSKPGDYPDGGTS